MAGIGDRRDSIQYSVNNCVSIYIVAMLVQLI